MSVIAKPLIQAQFASSTATTEYTVPSGKTVIVDKFTATNTDLSARTISVYIVPSGESVGVHHKITSAYSIAAGTSVDLTEMKNQILATGDLIAVEASATGLVVIRASGREIT